MDERSARRNRETGCQNGPVEVFPLVSVGCARIPILARSINAPYQRSDTLMQLSRSPAQRSALQRTAGPYILAQSVIALCPRRDGRSREYCGRRFGMTRAGLGSLSLTRSGKLPGRRFAQIELPGEPTVFTSDAVIAAAPIERFGACSRRRRSACKLDSKRPVSVRAPRFTFSWKPNTKAQLSASVAPRWRC